MLIGRPAERYKFLKQNYLLATAATKPNLDALMAQLRDIDSDYRKPHGGAINKSGQGHRSKTKAVRAQCENCVLALNKQIHTNGEWEIE